MKEQPLFLAQSIQAAKLAQKMHEELMATGKAKMEVSPDCYVWTGTKEEFDDYVNKHWKP